MFGAVACVAVNNQRIPVLKDRNGFTRYVAKVSKVYISRSCMNTSSGRFRWTIMAKLLNFFSVRFQLRSYGYYYELNIILLKEKNLKFLNSF